METTTWKKRDTHTRHACCNCVGVLENLFFPPELPKRERERGTPFAHQPFLPVLQRLRYRCASLLSCLCPSRHVAPLCLNEGYFGDMTGRKWRWRKNTFLNKSDCPTLCVQIAPISGRVVLRIRKSGARRADSFRQLCQMPNAPTAVGRSFPPAPEGHGIESMHGAPV